MRWLRILAGILVVFGFAVYLLVFWPLRNPHPPELAGHGTLAIEGARIYASPDAPPIEDGTVLVHNGAIAAVGPDFPVPPDAQILPCDHCVVMAGFWNAHVHFTEPKWSFAGWKSAATLNGQLADMLTSHGFTTVADLGSDLRSTISLRRRIETGDLLGPKIYTAGAAIYPPHGVPYYLKNTLPSYVIWFMPQPETPEEAVTSEERNFEYGADILKLFTGSYVARGRIEAMPLPVAKAAVELAHKHGRLAFSHPSNLEGVQVAMDSGVDVLAHAPDTTKGVDTALLQKVVDRHMAMIPTLKMFGTTVTTDPSYLMPIYDVVHQFHLLGGQLIFGTDVGYMTDYSTEGEFLALKQSGLNAMDILRMLTTAPAEQFGVARLKGKVEPGMMADLVILDADPKEDVTAFSRVLCTVRYGRVIYKRK
jgi:imidazolonepropionase-like amidohydrolase